MKKPLFTLMALLCTAIAFAQVGVGTTTPNSTLDVRGSLSTSYRAFTTNTTATATDNLLVFTGTSAATITLPTAVGCDGRSYLVKNASTTGPTPVLTIATTSGQTIDGAASWTLLSANESITVISNGSNWHVATQSAPVTANTRWTQDGDNVAAIKSLGTTSNYSLPFITNNTEKMRLTNSGSLGIATTTPNSTFDVRGSVSTNYRAFTTATTAGATDNLLVFTGSSATTITLPTAVGCDGRSYMIKNASATGPTPALTIATTSAQTIDGAASWSLTSVNETITLISNGANWMVAAQSLPGGSGTNWTQNGNSVPSLKSIGTISNYSLPFITNNTEKMRLTNTGSLGVGTSTFNATNPEKLLVDAGTTTSVNAIVGKGSIDSYLQLNIQNNSAGASSSSDVVATANNGDETTNYVDMGINGGSNTSGVMGAANDSYLYNMGQNFLIGTGTAAKSLAFLTGGTSQATNERMRIDGTGKVGIGTNAIPKAAIGAAKFAIEGAGASLSGPHLQFTTSADNYPLSQFLHWSHDAVYHTYDAYYDGAWKSSTTTGGNFVEGKENGKYYWQYANTNTQGGAITWNNGIALTNTGTVGIGTSTFNGTYPEKLVVDAGTTTSVNAIVGKGSINNYLQLNIQNQSAGNASSSDVVATANNGDENNNYIDMGINGGSNTSGVMGNANDGYLYNVGQNLLMGTASASKSVVFLTGGTSQSANERMRIDGNGNVGIGNTNPSYKLTVNAASNPLYLSGVQTGAGTDSVLTIINGVIKKIHPSVITSSGWLVGGNSTASIQNLGTTSNFDLPFITNNTEKMRLSTTGELAIGSSTFNATNPEQLLVDAGTTTSVNAIVGKGSINSYLQLNIQNQSNGTSASSDVVATADNGSETTNFIDMGINSSTNTSGVMGAANDGYIYNIGQNLLLGTGTAAKSLVFMTGGTTQSTNERMRIDGNGLVGIGTNSPTSTLQVAGSQALAITTKTATYTATASDHTIICNNTGGAITINLPAAAGCSGRVYVIKKISGVALNVTIDANGAETIDGATTRVLTTQYETVMIQSNGTSWFIISNS